MPNNGLRYPKRNPHSLDIACSSCRTACLFNPISGLGHSGCNFVTCVCRSFISFSLTSRSPLTTALMSIVVSANEKPPMTQSNGGPCLLSIASCCCSFCRLYACQSHSSSCAIPSRSSVSVFPSFSATTSSATNWFSCFNSFVSAFDVECYVLLFLS